MPQTTRRLLTSVAARPQSFGIIEFTHNPEVLYAGPYLPSPEGPVPMTWNEAFYHASEVEALAELMKMTGTRPRA